MLQKSKSLSALALVIAAVQLSGCGLIFNNDLIGGDEAYIRDRGQDYEKSQEGKELVVPAHLDADKVQEQLVVPEIGSAATQSDKEFEIPRPDFFIAEAGNAKVNLAREGQDRLILVNEPQQQVWQKLQEFWASNDQPIAISDPAQGLMETAWIDSGEEAPGFISQMVSSMTFSDVDGPAMDKLRAYIKPVEGDASKTSIRLQHLRASISDTNQAADWSAVGQDVHYKSKVMYEILHYLSVSTLETTASAARLRQKQQGQVYFGRGSKGEPILKLTVPVDQAWDQVDQALQQAQVDVGSSNRQLGRYYITYTSAVPLASDDDGVGFFDWLHGDREDVVIDTAAFGEALGVESDASEGPKYSAKTAEQKAATEAKSEQQRMAESEGYKVWIGEKVLYVFSDASDDERMSVNPDTGAVEFTGRYQVKLTRRSSGVYVSILTEASEPAPKSVAEDILWTLKESIPVS
ncbi:MAG: outer membrane protein assembly factor BamC [Motiliproteus sp.]